MKKPENIVAWIKPGCPWCKGLVGWMREQGLECEIRDVIGKQEHYREMVGKTGQALAPCVEIDGHVLADTSAQEVEDWMRSRGFLK
jgi:monothiol glutaredoxin